MEVKAVTPFKKGEFVCQYVGELIPYKDAKQRSNTLNQVMWVASCTTFDTWLAYIYTRCHVILHVQCGCYR